MFSPEYRAPRGAVFFVPLRPAPAEFLTITARTRNVCVTLPPAPAMCMPTPIHTCKTLRIYATIIEMHRFCVFSCPAGENTSFYRLIIMTLMGLFVSFPWAACLLTHWSGKALLFCCFHLVFNEITAVLYSILLLQSHASPFQTAPTDTKGPL